MTQLDDDPMGDDEALILAQARRALSPTSADEQRVLRSVLPQLALPSNAPSASSGSPVLGSPWALRVVGSLAVVGAVALSGGLGYRQGLEAGIAQQNKAVTSVKLAPLASPAPAPPTTLAASPIETARPAPSAPRSLSAPAVARWRSEPPSAPAEPAARELAARAETSAPTALSALSAPSALSEPSAPGLDEEVRQLRRVERAIRESNPRLALVLLEELDRAIPTGQLLEERRAAGLMANCQLGTAGAIANARAFASQHATSAYLSRVIDICGLESERNSAGAGTHVSRSGG